MGADGKVKKINEYGVFGRDNTQLALREPSMIISGSETILQREETLNIAKGTILTYTHGPARAIRDKIMGTRPQSKDERINLRLKHSAKKILERAASFEGQTVSKFVLSSALARAEKTVQEHEAMMLNAGEAEAFFEALSAPVRFNKKLSSALDEYRHRVTSQ